MKVEVFPFDPAHHNAGTSSHEGNCAQGGKDTCRRGAVFSVLSDRYRVAACDVHLAGAVRDAAGMERAT